MEEANAASLGAKKTSGGKSSGSCLKCDPSKLPKPPYKQPVVKPIAELSKEAAMQVINFEAGQRIKRKMKWMKAHKKRRTHY